MWTLVESESSLMPTPRDSHILVNSANSIFLFGGSTGNPRSDFYEFKLDESKWVAVNHKGGKPPTSRFCHVGVVVKKKFFIFGGYDGDSRLNDFHHFLIDERTYDIPPSTILGDLDNLVYSSVSISLISSRVFQMWHSSWKEAKKSLPTSWCWHGAPTSKPCFRAKCAKRTWKR